MVLFSWVFFLFLFWHCIFPKASLWPSTYTVVLLFSMWEWLGWRGWGVVFSLKLWTAKIKELFSKPKSNAKCFSFPSICSSIWVGKSCIYDNCLRNLTSEEKQGGKDFRTFVSREKTWTSQSSCNVASAKYVPLIIMDTRLICFTGVMGFHSVVPAMSLLCFMVKKAQCSSRNKLL